MATPCSGESVWRIASPTTPFRGGQLKQEIRREAGGIALDGLDEDAGDYPIEGREIFIEKDPVAAHNEDQLRDSLNG
jgi:hypothetical protein